jgi:hypothetical protein
VAPEEANARNDGMSSRQGRRGEPEDPRPRGSVNVNRDELVAALPEREIPEREIPEREIPEREIPEREIPEREIQLIK